MCERIFRHSGVAWSQIGTTILHPQNVGHREIRPAVMKQVFTPSFQN